MRDLILLLALVGVIPMILRAPIAGVLAWIWITLMNPQQEVYGFLRAFELNFYIAILTLLAWFASRERKVVPFNLLTVGLVLFAAWSCVTTYTALDRQYSMVLWDRTLKSIFLALVVATLANTRARIQAIIWIVVVAIGYYAVKGGGFVLATGGHQHVFGPENTMIADNNSLGLVLIVLLPLMNYLRQTSRVGTTRLIMLGTIVCTFLAVLGTYSRGALVALVAAGAAYAMRSRSGILIVLFGAVVAMTLPSVLPSGWLDRMSTIQSADQDESFNGRVAAWKTSYNIARERFVGGGYSAVDLDTVANQFQSPGSLTRGRAAHSIYFEVLGDHGFLGLGLYVFVLAAAWLNTAMVLNATRGRPDLEWASRLARMLQVSMVAFMVGGAALSMAYYDGILVVLALTAALLHVVRQPAAQSAPDQTQPRWREITTAKAA